MIFSAQTTYWFQPKIGGNLELPESERLAVEIIRPTAEDRLDMVWLEQIPGKKGNSSSMRVRCDSARILHNNVGKIKNLTLEDDKGKKHSVSNGEELAAASFTGMAGLVELICAEVISDTLTDAQKKSAGSGLTSCGKDGTSGNSTPSTQTKK